MDLAPWPRPAAGPGGGGSLLFTQPEPSLTASMPWRAPHAGALTRAVVTLAEAIDSEDPVDVAELLVNGEPAATLPVDDEETSAVVELDVAVAEGDRVSIERLAVDGGAIQVQIDRGP